MSFFSALPSEAKKGEPKSGSYMSIKGVALRPKKANRCPTSTGAVASCRDKPFIAVCTSGDCGGPLQLNGLGHSSPITSATQTSSVTAQFFTTTDNADGAQQPMLLHRLSASFSPSGHDDQSEHAPRSDRDGNASRHTIAKVVWAGPRVLALLNACGDIMLLATQLLDEDDQCDTSSCSSSGEGEDYLLGSSQANSVLHRRHHVNDVAAASVQWLGDAARSALVVMAGHRALHVVSVSAARHLVQEDWPLGPFHAVATVARADHVILVGCAVAGALQVFSWTGPNRAKPLLLHQVLPDPRTSYLGLSSGAADGHICIMVMGVTQSASAATARDHGGVSLKGKDGRELQLGDDRLVSAVMGLGSRDPLNAVYASLQREPINSTAAPSTTAASSLDRLAEVLTIAAPAINSSSGEPFATLLTLSGENNRVSTQSYSLQAGSCRAALGKLSPVPLPMPTLRFMADARSWECILHDASGFVSLVMPLSGADASPRYFFQPEKGMSLVGLDWHRPAATGSDAAVVSFEGAAAIADGDDADEVKEGNGKGNSVALFDALRMSTMMDCPLFSMASANALPAGAVDMDALTAMIRAVVREEADRVISSVDERLTNMEQRLMAAIKASR